jgi:CO/xanthine dehydrogenase Mo-binding subunit
MPGVFAIYTAQDLDDLVEPVRASSRMKDYHATALYPLARGKVRYVGEPVVAILAENRYLAEDALDRIEIAYEPLGTVIDLEMAVREDADPLPPPASLRTLGPPREDLSGIGRKADLKSQIIALPDGSGPPDGCWPSRSPLHCDIIIVSWRLLRRVSRSTIPC